MSTTKAPKATAKNLPVDLSKSKDFVKFREAIGSAKRVLISTHQLPDGDGLGAEVALFHYLKRARKACRVYNPDPLPKRYRFLDPKGQILLGPGEVELWDTCDLWIIVDTNDPRRLGKLWQEMSLRARKIVFLDHHPDITEGAGEIAYPPHASVVADIASSSIGEMLHHVFSELDLVKMNQDIALGLYVSIMTDTNSFRYARTTPQAHRIAAEMVEAGVNPEEIYQNIYSSKEVSHLQLLGNMLQNVKVSHGGKVAWLEMGLDLRKRHQASADDTQSFLNLLLLLKDAEVVCLFREEDDSQIRVSIKSKGRVVINKVAMELGGGGHDYSAGLALSAPIEKTVSAVIKRLETLIANYEKFGK
ncbi:MAG: bifunctional oligoribonuclease/PAP phosphatase NrnA [Bdellovibrionales bacterium]|nr:bifunctional oligoribonuclease/PAP phosphatase NrnA [Bdellovibrionales bacterium]